MEKKILVATDGSLNSERAVSYVARLFAGDPELRVTLLNILPPLPPILTDREYGGEWQITSAKAAKLIKMQKEKAKVFMDKGVDILIRKGQISAEATAATVHEKKVGLARDIIHEAGRGDYDAVVIGRRGLSRMQSAIMGSISTKIVQGVQTRPVWVIDGDVSSGKILVAVDASDTSLMAVDHLGFIINGLPNMKILLYHVIPGLRFLSMEETEIELDGIEEIMTEKGAERIQPFFFQARKILLDAGVSERQVSIKIKKCSTNIARDIVSEATRRNFGTVVLARRGVSKSKEFFMGSVSNKVLSMANNLACWIV
ncbi:MAG: universal stress protein [Pseudomonadota bacterium]